ncbi:porin [Paraburkholderia sp. J12]|uniref:porin n=1 Tax=Paraburkholderia sp. J12 TaxID=2805432 RepID=UPI002ABDB302|nr:porin [Paraburkholderia sp. J12]
MKKAMIAALVLSCISAAARAQNSVTLYGLIDEGINFTSNTHGHSAWQTKSGDTVGSRWGLSGREDLGGGYHAIFRLENGFNVNNGTAGQGGRLFGRQAYVGLASDEYGTLTLGRQYDPTVDLFSGMTAAGGIAGDVSAHPFDNDNTDWDFRINNSVKYTSPDWHGLKTEAMYGFSNDTNFANNRMYSAAAQYRVDGFTAVLAYLKMNQPGSANGAAATDSVFAGSSQQDVDAAVSYAFAKTKVGFAWSHVDVYDPTSNVYFGAGQTQLPGGGIWQSWKFDNFELNAKYFFTSTFWLAGAYTFTDAHLHSTMGEFQPKWHQLSLMLDYDLSSRTSVYLQAAYQHVVSANTHTGFDFASMVASAGTSSGPNQMVGRVAMIHRF